jgi:hypothetical protein
MDKEEKQEGPVFRISRRILVYLLTMSLLSPLAVSVFGVWYTSASQKRTEQKFIQIQVTGDHRWCALLRGIDQPPTYPATVPLSARQKEIQRNLHELRVGLGC